MRDKNSAKLRERSANMSKKSFGSIIEKPNHTLYVKYIERYEVLSDGKRKPIYKVESTHSKSRRVAQARLDELEKAFGAKNEKERIDGLVKYSKSIQAGIDANRPKTPMAKFFDTYIEACEHQMAKPITTSTKRMYKSLAKVFADYMEGTKKIAFVEDVSSECVREYLMKRKDEVGESRFKNIVDVISHIYDVFVKEKMMLENPFDGVQVNTAFEQEQKRNVLTPSDVKKILDFDKEDRLQFLFVCSLTTGMRLVDCCHCRWSDIDLDDRTIHIRSTKTQKSNAHKMIRCHIHPLLMKEIEKAKANGVKGEYVWKDNADDYARGSIHQKVSSIFKKLKLNEQKKTFHSLRHTFVSTLLNNRTPIALVERLVGHSSTKMSMAYYHENKPLLDDAIASIPNYDQAVGDEVEVVRLPKSLADSIRAKGIDGETIVETLTRIVEGVDANAKGGDEGRDHHHHDIDALIDEIEAKVAAA